MPIHPLPHLWLLSDARNDSVLEDALARLPEGSGFGFRHYHLAMEERRERYEMLRSICRSKNHCVVVSGIAALARLWHADGLYAAPGMLANAAGLLRIATVHDAAEMALAEAFGAHGAMVSPVFPTRSHPEARPLGIAGFHALAGSTSLPVIALGGMTAERARELGVRRWAAIDGLS